MTENYIKYLKANIRWKSTFELMKLATELNPRSNDGIFKLIVRYSFN